MKKGYALYGKEGTLVLDLDADELLLGLKSEGGKLNPVRLEEDKIASWRVGYPGCCMTPGLTGLRGTGGLPQP